MKTPRLILALALALALVTQLMATKSVAQTKAVLDAAVPETVRQFNLLDPRHEELARSAAGILIFPQITKGGIALASEYGEGALQIQGTTVDYYSFASASVGLTAGMATRSEIILFMTADALDNFKKSKGWSIGADTGIAVISKGMTNDYGSASLQKPILVFMFGEKGLIADLSLSGSKIKKIRK
jgi:lipid-binding SYLF domain-containing protein